MTITPQPIPIASWPIVGPGGVLNDVWYRFLQALYTRTGGAVGPSAIPDTANLTALQATVSDINTKQIPLLQQRVSDLDVVVYTSETEKSQTKIADVISRADLEDIRVISLTQDF